MANDDCVAVGTVPDGDKRCILAHKELHAVKVLEASAILSGNCPSQEAGMSTNFETQSSSRQRHSELDHEAQEEGGRQSRQLLNYQRVATHACRSPANLK